MMILEEVSTIWEEGTFLKSRFPGDTVTADVPPNMVGPYRPDCPSRTVIETFANKWSMLVLGILKLQERPLRFNELRRRLDGITQKVLTRTLRALERDGLVRRTVYPTVPPRVEYALTDLGVSAGHLANAIAEWSVEHVPDIIKARENFDHRGIRRSFAEKT
ncbi:winged helix-turn-helix transcriptional regulator [Nonomuraea aurantiaca]|uniref:winged helix-turn-helix transcriptional regulator n=1 Tax=Nonomuraea aurantiaca TaxID=2878562 RepID=UPI0027E139B9|nr:helix-turn-helix domain-containing protein [Nonomuraea aurantiaca]